MTTLRIEGDGAFGTFLRDLLRPHVSICRDAATVILAVPEAAYIEVARQFPQHHLVNVCSVQERTTAACLAASNHVTSLHPLFGPRTPAERRFAIVTKRAGTAREADFLRLWLSVCGRLTDMTPSDHDRLMARTHVAAVRAAQLAKPLVEAAADVDDASIPHSFRLLRQFVQTLDDMPAGTLQSILANPYRDAP